MFQILDFSARSAKKPRTLNVINASEIPRVSDRRKMEMLEVFAEELALARAELSDGKATSRETGDVEHYSDPRQDSFTFE